MAEWFADIFGQTTGAHLRRIHYRLVARGDVVRADGVLYENDANSWAYLNNASRYARYLGLVDPENIIDRRNLAPHIYMSPGFELRRAWSYEVNTNPLDRILTHLGNNLFPPVEVETEVSGYLYEEALQPYHVEVWAEKTTMNDIRQRVLGPILSASRKSTGMKAGAAWRTVSRRGRRCPSMERSDGTPAGATSTRRRTSSDRLAASRTDA